MDLHNISQPDNPAADDSDRVHIADQQQGPTSSVSVCNAAETVTRLMIVEAQRSLPADLRRRRV
jgi:hypothetical protein